MRIHPLLVSLLAAPLLPAAAFAQPAARPPVPTPAPASAGGLETGAVLAALEKVCLPLAHGGDLVGIAKAGGLRQENGQWVLPIAGPEEIVFTPPDTGNPNLCTATLTYVPSEAMAIYKTIDAWAADQSPPLKPVKVQAPERGPSLLRLTSTWEGTGTNGTDAVVLSQEETLQGQPVDGKLEQAELLVDVTPAKPS